MKLRIWTLAAALVIVIAFGLALPTLLSDKTAEVAVNYEQVKADFKTELIESFAALNYQEPTALAEPLATEASEQPATVQNANGEAATLKPVAVEVAVEDQTEVVADATEITDGNTPLGGGEVFVKDGWINEKINSNRDKINDGDLARGADIYNRLDTDFIFGLADGGLTDIERKQVDEYLKSQLQGADYEIAQNLYYKYVGLLKND